MTAVLERIALNKLQRPCSDLCDLLFVSLDYTGRFREEISLGLVILLSRRLPACLMFLSPSVASFSFFSPLQPRMVSSSDSHQLPPSSLAPRPCSSSGVHTSGFYHVCCCSCFPSISPTGQLPPLSFFLFCFSIPVCNSLPLVALILPPTAPRNALPFLSLDLFLRVGVFSKA